jgi:hypothetical protein
MDLEKVQDAAAPPWAKWVKRVVGGFAVYWVLSLVFGMAVMGAGIYVLVHFVSKFW